MRLARSRSLAVSPLQIQGIYGKLLCCPVLERPLYVGFLKQAPQVGGQVITPDGPDRVVGHVVPTGEVAVRTADGVRQCPLTKICVKKDRMVYRTTPDRGS